MEKGNRGLKIALLTPNFFIELRQFQCKCGYHTTNQFYDDSPVGCPNCGNPYDPNDILEPIGKDRIIFGGSERMIVDYCHMLQENGHDVTVFQPVCLKKGQHPFGKTERIYKGIKFVCLESRSQWDYGVNPELNMTFNEMAMYFDLRVYWTTYCAYPEAKKPCITISHGIWFDYPHYTYNMLDDVNKKAWLDKNLYGFYAPDICVSVDGNTKRVIQAMAPGKADRIAIIPNYVDTKKFKPTGLYFNDGLNDERIKVLFPRRLTILRGCNEFIKASKDYPQYDYLSVGQSVDEASQNALTQQMNQHKHIQFIHKEMDGMEEVYQWADIAVIPTKACEGTSLSLLEAMATGLPIITTPVGGLADLVINGYNALIFDPDHDDLGEAIDYLAQDPELRLKMGERNRQIAVECFDISIWKSRWMNIINSFI